MYKERLFADASYYAFHAINSGCFHVEHGRLVLALSQIVPLIGYYLYLPLQWVLVLSSVGHELFYYGIFLLLYYGIKDKKAAVLLILVHLIGQLWLYYSPMLEISYGGGLAVLFFAILHNQKYKDDKWLILLLITQWFVMTSHLENFLLIVVAIAYDVIQRSWRPKIHLPLTVLTVIGLLMEFLTFSSYESDRVFTDESKLERLSKVFNSEYLYAVGEMFLSFFPELVFFAVLSIVYLISKKKIKVLLLLLASTFALLFVVNMSANANYFMRYHESMYNPLVFVLSFFFVYELLNIKGIWLQRALLTIVVLLAFNRIGWTWNYGEDLRKRSAQLERIVDYAQMLGHSKYLIEPKNMQKHYSHIAWSNPIETLFYSAIDGKDKSLSIATTVDYEYNKNFRELNDSNYMFRMHEIKSHDFLNSRFFKLKKEGYQRLNNSGVDGLNIEAFASNLSIDLKKDQVFTADDTLYLMVELKNDNESKLPSSLTDQIYISYHLYQDGALLKWDGLRTPIEVDVFGSFSQHINFAVPEKPGVYQVVPDIVIEGKTWFNLGSSVDIVVE